MKKLTLLTLALVAMFFGVACDAATSNDPAGVSDAGYNDIHVVDANVVGPKCDGPTCPTSDAGPVEPDLGVEPIEEPCAPFFAANLCRRWQYFELNGHTYSGILDLNCEEVENEELGLVCGVTPSGDQWTYVVTFPLLQIPTEANKYEASNDAETWVFKIWFDHDELRLYAKTPDSTGLTARLR